MRVKINIDTMTDIQSFVNVVSDINVPVILEDGNGLCVSAKSLLGSLYAMEFENVYCCCEKDISGLILKWIV